MGLELPSARHDAAPRLQGTDYTILFTYLMFIPQFFRASSQRLYDALARNAETLEDSGDKISDPSVSLVECTTNTNDDDDDLLLPNLLSKSPREDPVNVKAFKGRPRSCPGKGAS